MVQQVNLCHPMLLAPQHHFSAHTMLRALAVLVLGLALLAGWLALTSARLRHDINQTGTLHASERQGLLAQAGAGPRRAGDAAALAQELALARQALAERQLLLAQLGPNPGDPRLGPAAVLGLVARTLPGSAWLTELKLQDHELQLKGQTLQPDALPPWLAALADAPALQGRRLVLRQVERNVGSADGHGTSWAFQAGAATTAEPAR